MAGVVAIIGGLVAFGVAALAVALLVRPKGTGAPAEARSAPRAPRATDPTVHVSEEARQAATYAPPAVDEANIARAAAHGLTPDLAQALWNAVGSQTLPEAAWEACFAERVEAYRALRRVLQEAPQGETTDAYLDAATRLDAGDLSGAYECLTGAARAAVERDLDGDAVPEDRRLNAAAAWSAAGDLKRVAFAPAEAATCYLEAAEQAPEGHGALRGDYLNMWGIASDEAGNYGSAEDAFTRAVQVRRKAQGANHPDVAMAQNNLGEFYMRQGRHAVAEPLFRKALAIRERALGPTHADLAVPLKNLADLYRERGQAVRAEPYLHRLLTILEMRYGADAIELVGVLDRMGRLCMEQSRGDEAEPILRRALAVRENRLGPNHAQVADNLLLLGDLYQCLEREVDAEMAYEKAVQVREAALGPTHAKVGDALVRLAGTYMAQERIVEARPLLQRALEVLETPFGAPAPRTGEALAMLGEIHRRQGRHADAGPLFRRALKVLERTEGPRSELLATTLDRYAQLYHDMQREADANRLTARAESVRAGKERRPARV
jgi:tetratricopeptide (TPR) repeat protein